MKDYYKILGVDRNSDKETIKKAYRSLAKKYHPDLCKDDPKAEEKFKEINEAFENLMKKKDHNYTNYQDRNFVFDDDLSEIFNFDVFFDFFTDNPSNFRFRKNNNLYIVKDVSLRDVFFGNSFQLSIRRYSDDIQKTENIIVQIPIDGHISKKIIIPKKGKQTFGGPPGDLIVNLNIIDTHGFKIIDKNNLLLIKNFKNLPEILGNTVTINTIENKEIKVKIPENYQLGTLLRIKGKGLWYKAFDRSVGIFSHKRGDMFLKIISI